jgi:hypothetical protein
MNNYIVTYEEQRPGWDETGYVRIDDVVVQAESAIEAMNIVNASCKYYIAYQARIVK